MRQARLLLLAGAVFFASPVHALEVPELRAHVNDYAHVLGSAEVEALEQKLGDYEQRNGHQFAFLSIASLEGDSLEDFSIHVGERWKLGHKGKDDGLILLVVPSEHKMRIEVGYGLEGVIPDAFASRVIHELLAPAFRRSDYSGGIDEAFNLLMKAADDPSVAKQAQHNRNGLDMTAVVLFILFGAIPILFALFSSVFGSRGRRRGRGMGWFIGPGGFGGGGFGGWSGGGGGGGGWGGGGGGGFGGGGASGSW